MSDNLKDGYLYCLYSEDGQKNDYFHKELIPSFTSLKLAVPTASVSLYTNVKFNNDVGFDHVIYDEDIDKRHIAKAHALLKSPYDRTIFLDTDTIIHRDIINDIFKVLDEFNFAVVYGGAFSPGTIYPDFNTGLIGVTHNDETNGLLSEWVRLFEQTPPLKTGELLDQWSFREVFMKNKTMFHVLPTYFMYRGDIIRQYPRKAVMSHDRSPVDGFTYKSNVTKKIIYNYVYALK
tara:strand:- start:2704 stop:3405 length:702 start_codon:yes stop_codon:yes gene_type:complete